MLEGAHRGRWCGCRARARSFPFAGVHASRVVGGLAARCRGKRVITAYPTLGIDRSDPRVEIFREKIFHLDHYTALVEREMGGARVGTSGHHESKIGLHGAERGDSGPWSVDSWRAKPGAEVVRFEDARALRESTSRLAQLPPLVTSWEIERLKSQLDEAQRGERFVLQGGDCAESIEECRPETIAAKLKILLQMSLVLARGAKRPVVRMGRFAGQYAKPRTSAVEVQRIDGREVSLPSYFGDMVNSIEFTPKARTPDPSRLVGAYMHAAATLNFVRSLVHGGFADMHHPENWELPALRHASPTPELRARYERLRESVAEGVRLMESVGERTIEELARVEFFTCHEALMLEYEAASTRSVPRRTGFYDLSTHMPWVGERTRHVDGAHVEFARGIRNPVGVKIGPTATPEEVVRVCAVLNPHEEGGKVTLITRLGAMEVERVLPGLIRTIRRAGHRVLWICDPMHGNGRTTSGGLKTRRFEDITAEFERTLDVHRALGSTLGGLHVEVTGEDVAECVGGMANVREEDLDGRYRSVCDPRLNYQQALELSFVVAERLGAGL